MSVTKSIHDGLTEFKVIGAVNAKDIMSAALETMGSPEARCSVWDFSRAVASNLDTPIVEKLANDLTVRAANSKGGKVALVGFRDVNIGLGKLFGTLAALAGFPHECRSFRNMTRALEWLKAPEPVPEVKDEKNESSMGSPRAH